MNKKDPKLQAWIERTGMEVEGSVEWQLCLKVCFVYHRTDVEQSRRDVMNCLVRYLEMAGPYMTFWAAHGKHQKRYTEDVFHQLKMDSETSEPNGVMQFYIHSGRSKNEAGSFCMIAVDSRAWEIEMGRSVGTSDIEFYFPLGFFATSGQSLPDFVLFCAQQLKPYWGYAGIGLSKPRDEMKMLRSEPVEYMIAWGLPELEVQNIAFSVYAHQGLRPPSWMTVLGEEEVAELGGLGMLEKELPTKEGFVLTPYEGGLAIQAGPEPLTRSRLLGTWEEFLVTDPLDNLALPTDPQKMAEYADKQGLAEKYADIGKLLKGEFLPIPKAPKEDFPLLYKLAKVLKPLRAELPRQLHDGYYGEPYFDQARTLEYYARFDEEEKD